MVSCTRPTHSRMSPDVIRKRAHSSLAVVRCRRVLPAPECVPRDRLAHPSVLTIHGATFSRTMCRQLPQKVSGSGGLARNDVLPNRELEGTDPDTLRTRRLVPSTMINDVRHPWLLASWSSCLAHGGFPSVSRRPFGCEVRLRSGVCRRFCSRLGRGSGGSRRCQPADTDHPQSGSRDDESDDDHGQPLQIGGRGVVDAPAALGYGTGQRRPPLSRLPPQLRPARLWPHPHLEGISRPPTRLPSLTTILLVFWTRCNRYREVLHSIKACRIRSHMSSRFAEDHIGAHSEPWVELPPLTTHPK